MTTTATEFLTTKPLLLFTPCAVPSGRVAWQSKLAFRGARLRLEEARLYVLGGDGWSQARLTAALPPADIGLPKDCDVLFEMQQAGAVERVSPSAETIDVLPVERVAADDALLLLRVDPSCEFALLMEASEDLRIAAEEAGFSISANDVGQDRSVSLAICTPEGEEIVWIGCETTSGRWEVCADEDFADALAFADPCPSGPNSLHAILHYSEIEQLCRGLHSELSAASYEAEEHVQMAM